MRREVVLPAGREAVWAALTQPERLSEWLGGEVDLVMTPGREGVVRTSAGERWVLVEEVTPPERLLVRWGTEDGAGNSVEFTLEDAGEGTLLRVEEAPAYLFTDAVSTTWVAPSPAPSGLRRRTELVLS